MIEEWNPKVLTEYEIGKCLSAIEAVDKLGKPIAEVMTKSASIYDLQDDLVECLKLSNTKGIRFWIYPSGTKLRFGFFRFQWALDALKFLDRATLTDYDRHWISGLLFGYTHDKIQEFIDKQKAGT